MTTPAAAAGVNTSTARHLNETEYRPIHLPDVAPPSTTNSTKRTKQGKIPLRINDMPYAVFVDHLRTIYGDDEVGAMLNGLARIDASGTTPAVPWPEPQSTPPAAATANNRIDFSDELDAGDSADIDDSDNGNADPYL